MRMRETPGAEPGRKKLDKRVIGIACAGGALIWSFGALLIILPILGVGQPASHNNAGAFILATETAPPAPTLTAQQLAYVDVIGAAEASAAAVTAQSALDSAHTFEAGVAASAATFAAQPSSTPTPRRHDLELLSASCTNDVGFLTCQGSVLNTSGSDLRNIVAVLEMSVGDGVTRASDEALISYNPVLDRQASPWTVITSYNPALTKYRITFKTLGGGTLDTGYCASAGGSDPCN